MASGSFRFDRFTLDPDDRRLTCDGAPVELSARYLDALALLVREPGKLVSKERFIAEVWRGVPVTDEALTQCVKTLRRTLGDDAANPRFIETVPKYGYRFIGALEGAAGPAPTPETGGYSWRRFLLIGGAGALGAGVAGLMGGAVYGFIGASQPLGTGAGASVLLVLLWLTVAVALMGGAGVSFGIAAAGFARGRLWTILGGALGGLVVGGAVKLLGLDAFNLLLGRSPGGITGAPEGVVLGAAVGLGAWLGGRGGPNLSFPRRVAAAALAGGVGGVAILLLGGRLMAGSLDLLARTFPGSRLNPLSDLFGQAGYGHLAQIATGGFEGALFGGCIVGAMLLARRGLEAEG